jgi:predicted GNAT superfamily acetyltransferase
MRAPAGLVIGELETIGEISLAFDLFNQLWGSETWGAVPINVMKAMAHSRNYVAGAWRGDRLVGASLAFAWGDLSARALHSHISGVVEDLQGQGIGHALKLHQRAWAARHGYERITWTFDPLVQRNAWFNLTKLGARIEEYEPDFYGPMDDGINAGDATDRCLAVWDVEPGTPAAQGEVERVPALQLLVCGDGEVPVVAAGGPAGARVLSCQVPRDIVGLRRAAPDLALRWRHALRDTMGAAIDAGFVACAMTRDGCYILERDPVEDRSS